MSVAPFALALAALVTRDARGEAERSPPTAGAAAAAPIARTMTYRYNAPESALDRRYEYHWEILRTALERTRAAYGPYEMVPAVRMSESRQAAELQRATDVISVMYLGTKPEFERTLLPVRIPVDKNLGGYCIFLIRREDQSRFAAVRGADDLRALSVGLGLGWLDVDILRANQYRVVTGSSYDGLFDMLANRRFDGFLRATVEILGEYEVHHVGIPSLAIEERLLVYYPLPMYFWFAKSAEGARLAERARVGMMEMIADGTYDRIFFQYQGPKLERLHLRDRRVIKIDNPFVGPETPFDDARLWFDPTKEKAP